MSNAVSVPIEQLTREEINTIAADLERKGEMEHATELRDYRDLRFGAADWVQRAFPELANLTINQIVSRLKVTPQVVLSDADMRKIADEHFRKHGGDC